MDQLVLDFAGFLIVFRPVVKEHMDFEIKWGLLFLHHNRVKFRVIEIELSEVGLWVESEFLPFFSFLPGPSAVIAVTSILAVASVLPIWAVVPVEMISVAVSVVPVSVVSLWSSVLASVECFWLIVVGLDLVTLRSLDCL